MECWEGKEMKDTWHLVNLIAIWALQSWYLGSILLYTRPTVGLPAQDILLWPCWKNNKHNMWSLQLSDLTICLLSISPHFAACFSVLWECEWSAGALTHRWSCLMTECGWRWNCGNSLTMSSVITSAFPTYTHKPRQSKESIVTQTH